jgi:Spy/CpxP family protein refolding chaperone
MNSWKVILATVVIFGAGVLTGGLLVNHVDRLHPKHSPRPAAAINSIVPTNSASQPKPPHLPELWSRQFIEQLNDELQLTPEQHVVIEKIIADGQGQMRKAVQAVRQEARQKLREQLTPGQQKQFEELMKRALLRHSQTTNAPPPAPANSPPDV